MDTGIETDKALRARIREIVEGSASVNRGQVAALLGTTDDDLAFRMEFNSVIHGDLYGVATVVPTGGENYEIRRGEEGAKAAHRQSGRRVGRALRALLKSAAQAAQAPEMTDDEHLRSALERRADRAELMAATVGDLRRKKV